MNATELRENIVKHWRHAKSQLKLERINASPIQHNYWKGYHDAMMELMSDDIIHGLQEKGFVKLKGSN